MEFGLLAVIAVLLLVGASILSSKVRIAAPLLLVIVGIGIGFLPFVPLFEVDPKIILVVVLPPLLYAASVNVPIVDFRRNVGPVIGLSVVLVIFSALVIGALVHWAIPQVPFAAAVALGAVTSPTDAVAATAIGKRLGMPERVVAILEGESLVNDATSLVLLKTAVAAVSGTFVLSSATGSFFLSVVVAIAVGFLVGIVTVGLRTKLTNPVHDTIISFIVPFVAFIPAEELHGSGVLAVVVTGLYTGHHASMRFTPAARINERLNWHTIQFVLENGVFLIMGLQLHALVERIGNSPLSVGEIAIVAGALALVLILCRTALVAPMIALMRNTEDRYRARSDGFTRINERVQQSGIAQRAGEGNERLRRRLRWLDIRTRRSQADLKHAQDSSLGWREGAAISWSGMRGVVTLAAAQSISTAVPFRPQLVLAAFIVAVITLLLHGLTLPVLIRKLWPPRSGSPAQKTELGSLVRELIEASEAAVDDALLDSELEEGDDLDEKTRKEVDLAVRRARASARDALVTLAAGPVTESLPLFGDAQPAKLYQRLLRLALQAQRDELLEQRAIGAYSSRNIRAAELALDAYESHLPGYR